MDNAQYRREIERTMNKDLTEKEKLSMLAMGLAGEAGEVVDHIKKYVYHEHPMDLNELVEELGDLEYYLQHLKEIFYISDSEVYEVNINKLKERYPNGFTPEDSINRAKKA